MCIHTTKLKYTYVDIKNFTLHAILGLMAALNTLWNIAYGIICLYPLHSI